MFGLKNWWRGNRVLPDTKFSDPSQEWILLESALHQHDFDSIIVHIRPWCMLAEHDINRLVESAQKAAFTEVELNKLKILFEYYSNNVATAFALAQEHMEMYGLDVDLHTINLVCLYQSGQFEQAWADMNKLSKDQIADIKRSDYWLMASIIRWSANELATLEATTDHTIALAPDDGAVLQTALAIYVELGAQNKIDMLLEKLAAMPDAQGYAYSLSTLALGDYASGLRQMEARYNTAESHRYLNGGLKSHPLWLGESLVELRLLVSAEQGLGDTIQMARYFPTLQAQGAKEVLLETQPETLSLLQYNFPAITIVERQLGKSPDVGFDRWVGLMSLPLHLRLWGKDTPGRTGYLRVPPDNAAYWQQRVAQLNPRKLPKIGLAWSGQPAHRADRRRSVPFALMMAQVRPIHATFFALQTTVPDVMPPNVINVTEEMITLADTAALIEQMDLVITVDTSIVHIAGALAKETWLLLPKRYEWRWGLEGEENDWYDTVKVVRQTEHANWLPVLQDVFERRLHAKFDIERG